MDALQSTQLTTTTPIDRLVMALFAVALMAAAQVLFEAHRAPVKPTPAVPFAATLGSSFAGADNARADLTAGSITVGIVPGTAYVRRTVPVARHGPAAIGSMYVVADKPAFASPRGSLELTLDGRRVATLVPSSKATPGTVLIPPQESPAFRFPIAATCASSRVCSIGVRARRATWRIYRIVLEYEPAETRLAH